MKELRRLVWRYRANPNAFPPEYLEERFNQEAEQIRNHLSELASDPQLAAGLTPALRKLIADIERSLLDAAGDSRTHRFEEAYRAANRAVTHLATLEEAWLAVRAIRRTEETVLELQTFIGGIPFVTVTDFEILLVRCRQFFDQSKYRMARALAGACDGNLKRLNIAVTEANAVPAMLVEGLKRQRALAARLVQWGSQDAEHVRAATDIIGNAMARGRFELSYALLRDLETENAPIETFVAQLGRSFGEGTAPEQALSWLRFSPPGSRPDWRGATARLVSESLKHSLQALSRPLPPASSQSGGQTRG